MMSLDIINSLLLFVSFALILSARSPKEGAKLCEPRCGKCGYDLRANWKTNKACPECGAELYSVDAIHFGKYEKSNRFPALQIVILTLSLLLSILFLTQMNSIIFPAPAPPTQSPSSMTPTQIIDQLQDVPEQELYWKELTRRYTLGMINHSQINQTIQKLIKSLEGMLAKYRGPLLWSDQLVENIILDNAIPMPTAQQLAKVYFNDGPTYFRPNELKQYPGWFALYLSFSHSYALSDNLPLTCELVSVTSETALSRPLYYCPENRLVEADSAPPHLPMDISNSLGAKVCIRRDLLPGKHTLLFTFKLSLKPSIVVETQKRVLVIVKNDGNIQILNSTSTDVESKNSSDITCY